MPPKDGSPNIVYFPRPGYNGLVEKRVFEYPGPFVTANGETIPEVRIGYETIGSLNAAGDNAILIVHPYYANSHFAGRYRPDEPLPGYWDAIVGPGKPLDTDRYFLVSADCLCNLFAKDRYTVTTGPASIDPATGRPYGMRFPYVQIGDFVAVQKALLDHLGVRSLAAVMGLSMGSAQAFEWAAIHPEMVERLVAAVPTAGNDPHTMTTFCHFREAIMIDPNWRGGDYYGGPEPEAGLALALKLMCSAALSPSWALRYHGRKWADPDKDPVKAIGHDYSVYGWLNAFAASRMKDIDANNMIYLSRVLETYMLGGKDSVAEGLALIRTPTLLLPSADDRLLPVALGREIRDILTAQDVKVRYQELDGPWGHLNGAMLITQASDMIMSFLAS